ncbi:hypothetical protein FIU87_16940 [Bacillus sp. THAF10]|uniref:hypothetical protein n=1 Tax=Bacillus sp. THAF10 TaxID=2587848 RepID=UPI0012685641|nr:hypothetical protein [Bacillus sp. THAF10]QFT90329.1 hypothetical protein FIU87_16940 [Bacillus sp. THAF10]
MDLVKITAFIVALCTSIGLFLFSYFETIRICNQTGKVYGEGMVFGFSLALFFALMANELSS